MTDHNSLFDLLGRDVSAMLGIAEYLDVLGRERVANLVRTVTFNIEQTVNDLRLDLLHTRRRGKLRAAARSPRERINPTLSDRRGRASGPTARRAPAPTPRPKPLRPVTESTRTTSRVST
jgi:hypothetical protein